MTRYLILLLGLFYSCAFGATWYLDKDVIGSSSNAGTSWANAWTNAASINWSGMSAGDTLSCSGGTYGGFEITKSGASGSPITIKASQEVGHNDYVSFAGISVSACWITIDGSKSDTYGAGVTNVANLWTITNNINMHFGSDLAGIYCSTDKTMGHTFKWLNIDTGSNTNRSNGTEAHGISWKSDVNQMTNCVVEYCYVHDVATDSISPAVRNPSGYDQLTIRYSILWQPDDDTVEGVACTVHHCILARAMRYPASGSDPDGIQSTGDYLRFYNNILYDMGNSLFQTQGQAAEGGHYGNFQVYGNYFYMRDYPFAAWQPEHTTEMEIKWYPSNPTWNRTNITYGDFIFANNTVAQMHLGGLQFEARGRPANPESYSGFVWKPIVTNNIVVNNLWLKCTNSFFGFPYGEVISDQGSSVGLGTNYWIWTNGAASVVFDYNVWDTNNSVASAAFMGTNFSSGEAMASATIYKSNSSVFPYTVRPGAFDFRPMPLANIANAGTNLTSLNLPGWDTDLYGKARGTAPSIGAAEPFNDPDLMLWLTFEDNFTNSNYAADQSGRGHHAWFVGRNALTNRPSRFTELNINGMTNRNQFGYSAAFTFTTDNQWGDYTFEGKYLAVTNTYGFSNLSTATIACWGFYSNTPSGYSISATYTGTLLSAGDSTQPDGAGTWSLGRYNHLVNLNETRFVLQTNGTDSWMMNFPDGYAPIVATTTNWHHYAVTFSGDGNVAGTGTVVLYFDGVARTTNSVATGRLVVKNDSWVPYPWLAIGVQARGTPAMETPEAGAGTVYPNNGWLNGAVDDVRIYNRALSATELYAVYSNTESTPAEAGSPPARRYRTAVRASANRVRTP